MKKAMATLTALALVMGLTAAGMAQTAGKEVTKPAVKTETAAPAPEVKMEQGKAGEPGKADVAKAKKMEEKGKVKKTKKSTAAAKKEAAPVEKTPVEKTKKEEKKM